MKKNIFNRMIAIMMCVCMLPISYYSNAYAVSENTSVVSLDESFIGNFEETNATSKGTEKNIEIVSENVLNTQEDMDEGGDTDEITMTGDELQTLISVNYILDSNLNINGDLILLDGSLDLNGYELTINGSLIQGNAIITLNGGSLIVYKDYRMQSRELVYCIIDI